MLNQALNSGSNFVLGLYLVKTLNPDEFGLWGIAFASVLIYVSAGNAMLVTHLVVSSPDFSENQRPAFATRILVLAGMLAVSSVLLTVLVVGLGQMLKLMPLGRGEFFIATAVAASASLLKEFFVRHAYNEQCETRALGMHGIIAVCLLSVFSLILMLGETATVVDVVWLYGFAHLAAVAYGLLDSRLPLMSVTLRDTWREASEAWASGRYLIVANAMIAVRTHLHTIVAAVLIGTSGVGRINAARIFVSPFALLTPALTLVLMPRIAEARRLGPERARQMTDRYAWILLGCGLVYSIVIMFSLDWVSSILLSTKYPPLNWIVAAWCAFICLSSFRAVRELSLVAFKRFSDHARVNSVALLLTVPILYALTRLLMDEGAVLGLVFSEVVVLMLLYRVMRPGWKRPMDPRQ